MLCLVSQEKRDSCVLTVTLFCITFFLVLIWLNAEQQYKFHAVSVKCINPPTSGNFVIWVLFSLSVQITVIILSMYVFL